MKHSFDVQKTSDSKVSTRGSKNTRDSQGYNTTLGSIVNKANLRLAINAKDLTGKISFRLSEQDPFSSYRYSDR